jgi:hypothetical protein
VNEPNALRPSTLRLLAASYIDVLVISAVIYVIETFGGNHRYHWILTIIAFALVEPIVLQVFRRSIGHLTMAVVPDARYRFRWCLEPGINERANRVIRLLAVLLFYNGHRVFAESFVDYDFYYLAGHRLDIPVSRLYLGLVGCLWAVSALGMGRLKSWAPPFAIALQGLLIVNDLASLPLMREAARSALARASERAGSAIAFTPNLVMWAQLGASVLLLLFVGVVAVAYKDRFRFRGLV